jgi:hypothetical protein
LVDNGEVARAERRVPDQRGRQVNVAANSLMSSTAAELSGMAMSLNYVWSITAK